MNLQTLKNYYFTLRYLRLRQILGRIYFKLSRPRPNFRPPPPLRSPKSDSWIAMQSRSPMMLSPSSFCFLNEEREIRSAADWHAQPEKKLWLYNLHYFDDLNAADAISRREWHRDVMHRWIEENPPGHGLGWDPYPLSMRIMNWIKWAIWSNQLSAKMLHSLAVQMRYLRKHYDYHLLGNHLLVNGKTFIFGGLFFDGPEADSWFKKGLKILSDQIPVQILEDGGHFERSPMYHNLIVEDLLDLLDLLRIYGRDENFLWFEELGRMRRWASCMAHPDGEIALFNDAAFGIAPTARQLEEYAQNLSLAPIDNVPNTLVHLESSGYVRAAKGAAVLIANIGSVGPDYLPGHAHADTFSFELSIGGQRVVVDTGTGLYDITTERLRQRGTAAHNTLQVDNQNSSEVWSSFRVARRAKVNAAVVTGDDVITIEAAHDGYRRLPGCGWHRRTWMLTEDGLHIEDHLSGRKHHELIVAIHFHPDVRIERMDNRYFEIRMSDRTVLTVECDKMLDLSIENSTYHPQFGISLSNQKLVGIYRGALPVNLTTKILWALGGTVEG